ncbi:YlxR family protein [Zhihengliuella halotolerans]|uniref:YlxR family protein n=1 Tax=Zhihengliuella halotolerans TaxID=370736 RepID=UPI002155BEF5|nr:YlxR family protein [Zhihengliuella halotolerans]
MSEVEGPQRTCIGCRQIDDQSSLLRWALTQDDDGKSVVPDPRRRKSGRGAWMHPRPECAATVVRKRAFSRAFRAQVRMPADETISAAIDAFTARERADVTVQPESGSEI